MDKTVTLTKSVSYNFHKGEMTLVTGASLQEIGKAQNFLEAWAIEEIERLKKLPQSDNKRGGNKNHNKNGSAPQNQNTSFKPTDKQRNWVVNTLGYTGDFSEISSRDDFDKLIDELKGAEQQNNKNNNFAGNSGGSDTAF